MYAKALKPSNSSLSHNVCIMESDCEWVLFQYHRNNTLLIFSFRKSLIGKQCDVLWDILVMNSGVLFEKVSMQLIQSLFEKSRFSEKLATGLPFKVRVKVDGQLFRLSLAVRSRGKKRETFQTQWDIARQPNNNRNWNHITIGRIIAIRASYMIPKSMVSFLLSHFFFEWHNFDLRWLLVFLFVLPLSRMRGAWNKAGGYDTISRAAQLTCEAKKW